MPISWGTYSSQPPTVSGYDIEQYCRFFTIWGCDMNFARNAGLWTVTITNNGQTVAESGGHSDLFHALNDCYMTMRGLSPDTAE
jgi:hypothetical protein